jgi:DNA-binding NarL/FixJ family response regulator
MSAPIEGGNDLRVVIVDDDDINRRGMASLLAEDAGIEVAASVTHAEALGRPELWDGVDVVVVDAADERNPDDHFPGVAVVEEVRRRRPRGRCRIVVITGHFFDDAVRRRMREAEADFYYHRSDVGDAGSLRDAVLRPDAQRRVPEPVDQAELFNQGVTDETRVNRAVAYAAEHELQTAMTGQGRPRRAWERLRREFNREARLSPATTDGRLPDRNQAAPSRPQILRFLAWATRVKRSGRPDGEHPESDRR